jgi:hypothetical protein
VIASAYTADLVSPITLTLRHRAFESQVSDEMYLIERVPGEPKEF